jgi:hypothetical protein
LDDRTWSLAGIAGFVVTLVLYGAAPAWAGTTIDSYTINGTSSTFAQCGDNSDSHSDDLPPGGSVSGTGRFTASHSFSPATATSSCASGGGTDSTSGGLSSTGTVDSGGNLTLRDSNHGSTTTTAHFNGGSDCVDIGASIATSGTVQFTITEAMPFTFTGTATASGMQANGKGLVGYSLTGPSGTVFDQTQGAPSFTGTLPAGSYEYQASERASNDLACSLSGTETDSYHYSVTLRVGTPLPAPPTNTTLPSISGTPQVGHRLTCNRGAWNHNPSSFSYRWTRNGTVITGANHRTYTVQSADRGHTLACTVVASNAGGPSAPATSHGTGVAGPPKCTERSSRRVTIKHRNVNGRSKIVGGALTVQIECDQPTMIALSGQLTDQPSQGPAKHFQLTAIQAHVQAGTSTVLKLALPAAATTDLAHHAMETVTAPLTAQNANGTSHITATFSPLRT